MWTTFLKNNAGTLGKEFGLGIAETAGFYKGAAGKFGFLGGAGRGALLKGIGLSVGVGVLVYKSTDSKAAGIAASVGTMALTKQLGAGMKAFVPVMGAYAAYEGFKKGGVGGAVKAGVGSAISWGLQRAAFEGLKLAFKGTAVGAVGGTAAAVFYPLAIAAGLGYGAYKVTNYLAEYGRESKFNHFAGDTTAFNTDAAYTMRQRAIQEITRSHTNSRTVLGQEASVMHLR